MMKNPYSGLKNIPKNIWILSVATLINRAGTMVLPFLALYANRELKVDMGDAGLVLAFYGIGAFISAPFSGKLSDKIGAMRLMKISLISSGIFLFAYSIVTDFYLFLILSFLWAVISEAFRPASMAFISNEISADRRKTAFALNRLAINLGMSIGPVAGGILSTINFSLLFYVDGITSIAAAIYMLISPWQKVGATEIPHRTETHPAEKKVRSTIKDKRLLYFILALLPIEIVFFQHIGAVPLFIVQELGYTTSLFGFLISINTVLIIFIEVPLNDAMRMWPHKKSLGSGALLSGIGFGLLAISCNITPIIISIVIWTFGEMILFPAAGDYISAISPEKKRGEYMGYFQMTFSFAFMIGPWLGTEVLENFGSFTVWIGCFILGLISTLLMLGLKKI